MKNPTYFAQYTASHPSFTVMSEALFMQRAITSFELNIPLIITDATPRCLQKLEALCGDLPVLNVSGAATPKAAFTEGDLYIDGGDFLSRKRYTYGDLVEIVRRLRDPDGCPWDRAQTHESIRTDLLEECYELLEGIDDNDPVKMREEAGDVLLQAVFHAVIAEEEGAFTVGDIVSDLAEKLVSRHTHIFGANKANDPEEALKFWEQAKSKEKKQKSVKDKLDVVPKSFPALMRAEKVQKIIKKTGFDFPNEEGALQKLEEEIAEYRAAEGAEKEKEGGDILFAAVNVLRMAGIDATLALNGTTDKFIRRFLYVEEQAKAAGKQVTDLSLDEMEELYQQYKRNFEQKDG